MPYRNLADFLDDLGRAGELAPVDAEVDPCLEVAEVTRRIARQNGPALLFRNVKSHDIPLVTNLFGTESRILRALGADSIEEATARIDRALNCGGSEGWLERLRFGGKGGAAASFAANRVKSGACQQVVQIGSDIDLLQLPLLQTGKSAPSDGEDTRAKNASDKTAWRTQVPTMYAPVILSAETESHAPVFLRGDVQITDHDSAVAAWSEVADPARLTTAYHDLGARMPVAIVIGGDPALQIAATAPLPSTVDPLGIAGLLREKPIDSVACRTIDLHVPAEADLVIEGYIEPAELGHPIRPRLSPIGQVILNSCGRIVHVTAVTRRANPAVTTVVPDIECNDYCVRNRLVARIFLPYLRQHLPELVDFDLPMAGGARQLAVLAIKKSYSMQARHVATVAWGMRPFQFARLLVLVDADVDVRNLDQVLTAISSETSFARNVWKQRGIADLLDAKSIGFSRLVAVDATGYVGGAFWRADYIIRSNGVQQLVTDRWAEYGLGPEDEA
jgi:4-hydroxy-3-polyprenylbenzoate decarboxylase